MDAYACPFCTGTGCKSCGFTGEMVCCECGQPINESFRKAGEDGLLFAHAHCDD